MALIPTPCWTTEPARAISNRCTSRLCPAPRFPILVSTIRPLAHLGLHARSKLGHSQRLSQRPKIPSRPPSVPWCAAAGRAQSQASSRPVAWTACFSSLRLLSKLPVLERDCIARRRAAVSQRKDGHPWRRRARFLRRWCPKKRGARTVWDGVTATGRGGWEGTQD